MWSDNETDQDLLGFNIHAKLLNSLVTDTSMLPITVGLFGDWGGGKSSILKMLKKDLEERDDVAVISFNSWVFEGYDDAKSAILTTLLNELRDYRNLKNVIGDEVKSLLKRVNWMQLMKVGTSAGISILSSNPLPLLLAGGSLTNIIKQDQPDTPTENKADSNLNLGNFIKPTQESVNNVRSFRRDFQQLIEKTELRSLVILIDDLDRCSPERVIDNLEAIKLFLNVNRTAFVIATDRRIIENAIRIRYSELFTREQDTTASESLVTDYLEKLIQVPYTLPKLAPHEVRSYLNMLFLKKHLPEDIFETIINKFNESLEKDRYVAFQLGDELSGIENEDLRTTIIESLRLVEACSDAITDGLKGNPRQVKRFLNAFWIRKELAQVSNLTHLKDHILIKLMVLEYISAERFSELYQWHRTSNDGTIKQLNELETSQNIEDIPEDFLQWRRQSVFRWLKAAPSLLDEDLRDYFWVTRSSLSDTLSGVKLMSKAMKICAEELISSVDPQRKNGINLFESLSEDEQEAVLGIVAKTSMQQTQHDAPLKSLIDLSTKGYLSAAKSFNQCIKKINANDLKPGLGITLRNFEVIDANPATVLIGEVRDQLSKTKSKIGRALKPKTKKE